jgi:hypothetical protein
MKGNLEVNTFWETNLFPYEKPLGNDPIFIRKDFINQKYIKKKFRSESFDRREKIFFLKTSFFNFHY